MKVGRFCVRRVVTIKINIILHCQPLDDCCCLSFLSPNIILHCQSLDDCCSLLSPFAGIEYIVALFLCGSIQQYVVLIHFFISTEIVLTIINLLLENEEILEVEIWMDILLEAKSLIFKLSCIVQCFLPQNFRSAIFPTFLLS